MAARGTWTCASIADGAPAGTDGPGCADDHGRAAGRRDQVAASGEREHAPAGRHAVRVVAAAEREPGRDRAVAGRALPDLVEVATPDQPVGRGRAALGRRAAHDERSVEGERRGVDAVGVRGLALGDDAPVPERDRVTAELRDALGVGAAEEVASPVRLVLGHQRRALPLDPLADPLELEQLVARREAHAPVAERVRPQHAAGDRRRDGGRGEPPPGAGEPASPEHGRERDRRRGGRERLAAHPGRADRDERGAAREGPEHVDDRGQLPAPPAPREAGDRGGARDADQHVRRELGVGVEAEVTGGPDPGGLRGLERTGEVAAGAGVRERRGRRRQQRPGERSSAA